MLIFLSLQSLCACMSFCVCVFEDCVQMWVLMSFVLVRACACVTVCYTSVFWCVSSHLCVWVCRCGWPHVCLGLCVCVCSAWLCSPAAAALARDAGSVCRELKPDVMQQESPSSQSQVPTAAREIILKRCMSVCVHVCVTVSVRTCMYRTHECFLHIRGSMQGLHAPHAERGIAFSCFISCRRKKLLSYSMFLQTFSTLFSTERCRQLKWDWSLFVSAH